MPVLWSSLFSSLPSTSPLSHPPSKTSGVIKGERPWRIPCVVFCGSCDRKYFQSWSSTSSSFQAVCSRRDSSFQHVFANSWVRAWCETSRGARTARARTFLCSWRLLTFIALFSEGTSAICPRPLRIRFYPAKGDFSLSLRETAVKQTLTVRAWLRMRWTAGRDGSK